MKKEKKNDNIIKSRTKKNENKILRKKKNDKEEMTWEMEDEGNFDIFWFLQNR